MLTRLFLFVTIIFSGTVLCAQQGVLPIDEQTGQITYSKVIKVDSVSKDVLYSRAKEWFANTFKSAQDVIQLDDLNSGKVIGRGIFNVTMMGAFKVDAGYVSFKAEIQAKDGRYRYIFTDFWHEKGTTNVYTKGDLRAEKPGGGLLTMGNKNWRDIKDQVDRNVLAMISTMEDTMSSNSGTDDNW